MTPPRILIEDGDGAMSWAIEAVLSRRGYVVDSCAGPAWLDDGCPLVAGGTCQKVEDADAVFFALGADDREVLDATRERFPELPVVIQAFPSELVELGRLADGCETVTPAATGHGIATAARVGAHARGRPVGTGSQEVPTGGSGQWGALTERAG